ncbi:MAG: flippase-like domain-containing protein, partial [Myxococcales bacterium]|nr:flippase-like domain-containing protein [Myxococcales bacterium]
MNASLSPGANASVTRRILPKLIVSLLLGGLFAWLVARGGVPLIPKRADFASLHWWTVPAYAASLAVTHFFRASRWRFLIAPIKRLPLREVVALNWIGFFAIFALPLRLGELARPALTKARAGISISVGLGTV